MTPSDILHSLSFVSWDRGVIAEDVVTVFGWIPRTDGQRDFVYVEFNRDTSNLVWWATSNAKYSREIGETLRPDWDHTDCVSWQDALRALEMPA